MTPRVPQRRLCFGIVTCSQPVGAMLWLDRNRLVGSHLFLSSTSLAYFSSPKPALTSRTVVPGSKYDKAVSLKVPILDEDGFEVLLSGGPDEAREAAQVGG